jgi:tetratricopeptide (TPR) repeat protein
MRLRVACSMMAFALVYGPAGAEAQANRCPEARTPIYKVAYRSTEAPWSFCHRTPTRACLLDRARKLALSIGHADSKPAPLAAIAAALETAGLTQDSAATFEQAIRLARTLESQVTQHEVLGLIAAEMARVGKAEEAIALIAAIKSTYTRNQALTQIALAQARSGRFEQALRSTELIEHLGSRYIALRFVADAQAKAGRIAEAMRTVQAIDRHFPLANNALAAIAAAQAKAGMPKEAAATFEKVLSTARAASGTTARAGLLASIAAAQTAAGLEREANETIEQVLKLIGSGNVTRALQMVQRINDEFQAYNAIYAIAEAQLRAGRLGDALRTADLFKEEYFRSQALARIAAALPK